MAHTYQYRPFSYAVQDHSGAGVLTTAIGADVNIVHISTTVAAYIKLEGTAANSPSDVVSAYATGAGQISVTEMSS